MQALPRQAVKRRNDTLLDLTVKYVAPLVGLIGAVLFGVLRLANVFFYLPLRATPQEAGYGYLEILSGQLIGTVELALILAVFLLAGALALGSARHALAGRWRKAVSWPGRAAMIRLVRRCGFAGLATVLLCLPILALMFGKEAQQGTAVRNIYLLHFVQIPVLAVQASTVKVSWTAKMPAGTPDISKRNCLLYLGKAAGTAVFYDVATEESLHLPSTQILLAFPHTSTVWDSGCE
ncbi:hypothetical protein ACTI_49830 [Actinoplanes sp. OR16]|uniref:hypothetical protein n=1 Tax=Actinoplanes sp. OR16 TaxID=946334 RepID=UPI000F709BFC|nr:hypothetical protein [Actinoplanes sp. OR16]BBH68298.1 hypothetical protein ACTI_49830 [Actinoplanes sp. OR16]